MLHENDSSKLMKTPKPFLYLNYTIDYSHFIEIKVPYFHLSSMYSKLPGAFSYFVNMINIQLNHYVRTQTRSKSKSSQDKNK